MSSLVTTITDKNDHKAASFNKHSSNLTILSLSALGVVFGDIGTSPLYTLKTVITLAGGQISPENILGLLSLLFWTLTLTTSIKYVLFAMRIDNNGEGGIMALISLLGIKSHSRPLIILIGLFGAALIYGDGVITPAISVLSALEGLNIVFPHSSPYILPMAVSILIILFAIQPLGTAWIGKAFGPVMLLWFIVLAALGISGIARNPQVLLAINPIYGIKFLFSNGYTSFLTLGGVFLCVTGAEALYADMGHFGAKPIRLTWFSLVFPSLLLNYAGQAGYVLSGTNIEQNIFFSLCPPMLILPLVILATLATIIASQAIITGTFSMSRQAIQLGWLPRLKVRQTSEQGYGQIYIGTINWLLMIVTVSLAISFRSSDRLAVAYGIAVSLTMLITSGFLFMAMREIWHWSLWLSLLAAGSFFIIDLTFVAANLAKVIEGGYIPLLFAIAICMVMLIWHKGMNAIATAMNDKELTVSDFMLKLENEHIARVAGTAIFLSRTKHDIPAIVTWHISCNHVLQQKVILLTITVTNSAWTNKSERLVIKKIATNMWKADVYYGFMEIPDIPKLLQQSPQFNGHIAPNNTTYYIAHGILVDSKNNNRLPMWQKKAFIMMVKNSVHITDFYRLPGNRIVEIGRQIPI